MVLWCFVVLFSWFMDWLVSWLMVIDRVWLVLRLVLVFLLSCRVNLSLMVYSRFVSSVIVFVRVLEVIGVLLFFGWCLVFWFMWLVKG